MSSRRQRRSSILKSRNSIGPGHGADGGTEGFANNAPQTSDGAAGMEPTKSLRRVSFSHTNQVKEFCIERSNSSEEASFSKTSDFNQTMMDNNGQLDMSFAFSDMDRAEERENCPQRGRFSETLINENLDMSICSQSSVQFKSTIDEIQEKVCMLPPPVPSTSDHVSSRRFDMTIPDPVDMSFAYSHIDCEDKRESRRHRKSLTGTMGDVDMSVCGQAPAQNKSTADHSQQHKVSMSLTRASHASSINFEKTIRDVQVDMSFAISDVDCREKREPRHQRRRLTETVDVNMSICGQSSVQNKSTIDEGRQHTLSMPLSPAQSIADHVSRRQFEKTMADPVDMSFGYSDMDCGEGRKTRRQQRRLTEVGNVDMSICDKSPAQNKSIAKGQQERASAKVTADRASSVQLEKTIRDPTDMSFAVSEMDSGEGRKTRRQQRRLTEAADADMSVCGKSLVQNKSTMDKGHQRKVSTSTPLTPATTTADRPSLKQFQKPNHDTVCEPADMSFDQGDMVCEVGKRTRRRGSLGKTLVTDDVDMSICGKSSVQSKSTIDEVQQPKMTMPPPPPPPVTITITTDSVPIPMRFEKPSREAIRDPFRNKLKKAESNNPYGKFGSCKTPKRNKIQDPEYQMAQKPRIQMLVEPEEATSVDVAEVDNKSFGVQTSPWLHQDVKKAEAKVCKDVGVSCNFAFPETTEEDRSTPEFIRNVTSMSISGLALEKDFSIISIPPKTGLQSPHSTGVEGETIGEFELKDLNAEPLTDDDDSEVYEESKSISPSIVPNDESAHKLPPVNDNKEDEKIPDDVASMSVSVVSICETPDDASSKPSSEHFEPNNIASAELDGNDELTEDESKVEVEVEAEGGNEVTSKSIVQYEAILNSTAESDNGSNTEASDEGGVIATTLFEVTQELSVFPQNVLEADHSNAAGLDPALGGRNSTLPQLHMTDDVGRNDPSFAKDATQQPPFMNDTGMNNSTLAITTTQPPLSMKCSGRNDPALEGGTPPPPPHLSRKGSGRNDPALEEGAISPPPHVSMKDVKRNEGTQMPRVHDESVYNSSVSDVTSLFSRKYFEVAKKIDNFLKSAGRDDPFLEIDLLTKLSNYLVVLPEAELEYLVQKYDDFFLKDYISSIYIRRTMKYKFV